MWLDTRVSVTVNDMVEGGADERICILAFVRTANCSSLPDELDSRLCPCRDTKTYINKHAGTFPFLFPGNQTLRAVG